MNTTPGDREMEDLLRAAHAIGAEAWSAPRPSQVAAPMVSVTVEGVGTLENTAR